MTQLKLKKEVKNNITCSCCKKNDHVWSEVYYVDCSVLKRGENVYISWCKEAKKSVLSCIDQ